MQSEAPDLASLAQQLHDLHLAVQGGRRGASPFLAGFLLCAALAALFWCVEQSLTLCCLLLP